MSLGAYEYLLKPLELDPLCELVARAFEVSRLMRIPAVVAEGEQAENAPDLLVGRCRRHAGGLQGDRPGRAPGRDGPDPRRDRHRQGGGGPGDLPLQPPVRRSVPGDQLRRHPRVPARERAVRPRARGIHGCRSETDRQVRTVPGGHPVPGRDRRHDDVDPDQDPEGAARAAVRAGRRQRNHQDRRPRDRGHATATWSN